MYTAQPVKQVYTLETDHSSYFSRTDELAAVLLAIRDGAGSALSENDGAVPARTESR
jgi:hypothetical protein